MFRRVVAPLVAGVGFFLAGENVEAQQPGPDRPVPADVRTQKSSIDAKLDEITTKVPKRPETAESIERAAELSREYIDLLKQGPKDLSTAHLNAIVHHACSVLYVNPGKYDEFKNRGAWDLTKCTLELEGLLVTECRKRRAQDPQKLDALIQRLAGDINWHNIHEKRPEVLKLAAETYADVVILGAGIEPLESAASEIRNATGYTYSAKTALRKAAFSRIIERLPDILDTRAKTLEVKDADVKAVSAATEVELRRFRELATATFAYREMLGSARDDNIVELKQISNVLEKHIMPRLHTLVRERLKAETSFGERRELGKCLARGLQIEKQADKVLGQIEFWGFQPEILPLMYRKVDKEAPVFGAFGTLFLENNRLVYGFDERLMLDTVKPQRDDAAAPRKLGCFMHNHYCAFLAAAKELHDVDKFDPMCGTMYLQFRGILELGRYGRVMLPQPGRWGEHAALLLELIEDHKTGISDVRRHFVEGYETEPIIPREKGAKQKVESMFEQYRFGLGNHLLQKREVKTEDRETVRKSDKFREEIDDYVLGARHEFARCFLLTRPDRATAMKMLEAIKFEKAWIERGIELADEKPTEPKKNEK